MVSVTISSTRYGCGTPFAWPSGRRCSAMNRLFVIFITGNSLTKESSPHIQGGREFSFFLYIGSGASPNVPSHRHSVLLQDKGRSEEILSIETFIINASLPNLTVLHRGYSAVDSPLCCSWRSNSLSRHL